MAQTGAQNVPLMNRTHPEDVEESDLRGPEAHQAGPHQRRDGAGGPDQGNVESGVISV